MKFNINLYPYILLKKSFFSPQTKIKFSKNKNKEIKTKKSKTYVINIRINSWVYDVCLFVYVHSAKFVNVHMKIRDTR